MQSTKSATIAELNAQLAQAVSVVTELACEVQESWDNIPTLTAINVPMRDLMRDLTDAVRGGTALEYMANCAQWPRLA